MFQLDAGVDDGQSFAQCSQCAHQNVEGYISARLEVRYGLTATAHPLGYPLLRAAARLALGSNQGAQLFSGK